MASATDIITYIGVPLAVLGVTPIFYTFALALYTRLNLYRICNENGLEVAIRARLMTGVVEVDMPIYQLQPLERQSEIYWLVSKTKKISGASWSCFEWFMVEHGQRTYRLQRSDTLVLPEAKITFERLVEFLQDRGASCCARGFVNLRKRGQQTPGQTTLMESRDTEANSTAGQSPVPLLSFLKPHEGSISLVLSNGSRLIRPREFETTIPNPSSWITIPLHMGIYGEHLLVVIGTSGIEYISIRRSPNSGRGTPIGLDSLIHTPTASDSLEDRWFSPAVIAIFGHKKGTHYRFRTDQRMVHSAQWYGIQAYRAIKYGLFDDRKIDPAFGAWIRRSSHTLTSSFDTEETSGSHQKNWLGEEELRALQELEKKSRFLRQTMPHREDLDGHISMRFLLHFCLMYLIAHSASIEGLRLPAVPTTGHLDYPTFEDSVQSAAEAVVRTAILDEKFAEGIKKDVATSWNFTPHRNYPTKRERPQSLVYFCCGVVLLVIVGHRAEYLLSGESIEYCENEWKEVYLS